MNGPFFSDRATIYFPPGGLCPFSLRLVPSNLSLQLALVSNPTELSLLIPT